MPTTTKRIFVVVRFAIKKLQQQFHTERVNDGCAMISSKRMADKYGKYVKYGKCGTNGRCGRYVKYARCGMHGRT